MWVSTEKGSLVNLRHVGAIRVCRYESGWSVGAWDFRAANWDAGVQFVDLATFETKGAAQKALDRLEKWIASDGVTAGEPDFPGDTHAVTQSMSKVFSFRTLSEDDEF